MENKYKIFYNKQFGGSSVNTDEVSVKTSSDLIIGLAGTKSLIDAIKLYEKDKNTLKDLIIVRHSFSLNSGKHSHNQQIEPNFEKKYYDLVINLRNKGYKIKTFTQGSEYIDVEKKKTYISRYSGVKLNENKNDIVGNDYPKIKDKDGTIIYTGNEIAVNLVEKNKDKIIKWIKSTPHDATWLHDLKVYFVGCNFTDLMENNLIILKNIDFEILYHNQIDYSPYNTIPTEIVKEVYDDSIYKDYIINPNKISEFNDFFNKWLENNVLDNNMEAYCVVTDAGPGYFSIEKKNIFLSQDSDDAIAISYIPKIKNLIISDDTKFYSRTFFVLSEFSEKIEKFINSNMYLADIHNSILNKNKDFYDENNIKIEKFIKKKIKNENFKEQLENINKLNDLFVEIGDKEKYKSQYPFENDEIKDRLKSILDKLD